MKFIDWWREFSRGCPLDMTESEMAKQAWEAGIQEGIGRKRDADLRIGAWLSAALEDPSTCQSMKDDINEWFECTPEMHSIPMQKPTGDKPMKGLETDAFITVSDMVEHEDGSATFKIDTTTEATRLLVEIGLVSLLEKAVDENNKEYSLDPSLRRDNDEQETDN